MIITNNDLIPANVNDFDALSLIVNRKYPIPIERMINPKTTASVEKKNRAKTKKVPLMNYGNTGKYVALMGLSNSFLVLLSFTAA